MTVKAVLFDIDDTLVDHATAIHAATVALYSSLALSVGFEEFQSAWKLAHARHFPRFLRGEVSYSESSRARAREAIDAGMTDEAADGVFARYLADYERGWTLFPDVIPCLDELCEVSLGVVSNGRTAEQKQKLKKLGVEERFQCVCVSEELRIAKPAPQIFHFACKEVDVSPNDALYVGDQYELDACAARSAGLRSVWLNRRGTARPDCDVPMIGSLDALAALVYP